MNYLLYLRDRALLNYHFYKLGAENWQRLAHPDPNETPNPDYAPARSAFLAEYDLPEYRARRLTRRTKQDLKAGLDAHAEPAWALNLLSPDELKEIEEVRT